MVNLRVSRGIPKSKVDQLSSKFSIHFYKEAQKWIDKKHLILINSNFQLTKSGIFYVDQIASDLFYID